MDKRHNNPGRPVGSKDSAPRGPKKVSGLVALQNRFKGASDDLFTDADVAEVIQVAKDLAIIERDPKMIQFLLAKMWDSEKGKDINLNISTDNLRDVLDESLQILQTNNEDVE